MSEFRLFLLLRRVLFPPPPPPPPPPWCKRPHWWLLTSFCASYDCLKVGIELSGPGPGLYSISEYLWVLRSEIRFR